MYRFAPLFASAVALASSLTLLPLPAPAAVADDPCTTVTRADAAAAIGTPVVSIRPRTAGPSRSCSFAGTASLAHAVVTAFRSDSPALAHAQYTTMIAQTTAIAGPAQSVAGVGDEAAVINSSVYARKGASVYVFHLFGRRGAALTARARTLAVATLNHVH
jgi:hypothetical protein